MSVEQHVALESKKALPNFVNKAVDEVLSSKVLDLSGCCITHEGIEGIARDIKKATGFGFKLNLWCNYIGDEGASELSSAIKHTKLSSLELLLGCNCISNKGAKELAVAMEKTALPSLELDLWGNDIGDEGWFSLAKSTKRSFSRISIDFSDFRISASAKAALEEAFVFNKKKQKNQVRIIH